MKRSRSIKILALTLTLLVGNMAVLATERPFAGHGSGVSTFITDDNGKVIAGDVTGSGNATHLGLFTHSGRVYFTEDPNNSNLVKVSGASLFTAANGDKLNVQVEGVQDLTTGMATGEFRFIGGTGRFANASGIIPVVVQQNFITGGLEFTMVGRIDY